MKFTLSKQFISTFDYLSEIEKQLLIEVYDKIRTANSISEIDSSPMVGFPYLHTIEFGKYVIGIQVKNNEVELAGIAEKGKEMGLFF